MKTARLALVVDNTKTIKQGILTKWMRWESWGACWQKVDLFLLQILYVFSLPFTWLRWFFRSAINLMRVIYLAFWWCLIRLAGLVLLCLTLTALFRIAENWIHHAFL